VGAGGLPLAPSRARVRRSLDRILDDNVLCSVATVGPDGRAHIHVCYFAVSRRLELFFLSDPASRHAANLRHHPSAAVAVFSSAQAWGGPDRGAQLFGRCTQVAPARRRRGLGIYRRRFPGLAQNPAARELALYRFVTARATVLDEREFGDAVFVGLDTRRRPARPRGMRAAARATPSRR